MYLRLWLLHYYASLVTNISLPSEGFQPTEKPGLKEEPYKKVLKMELKGLREHWKLEAELKGLRKQGTQPSALGVSVRLL